MKPGHEALLKEVYEKRKPVKRGIPVVSDGASDKTPPFMKGRQKPPGDDVRNIKSAAAKRRLEMMNQRNPKGK